MTSSRHDLISSQLYALGIAGSADSVASEVPEELLPTHCLPMARVRMRVLGASFCMHHVTEARGLTKRSAVPK